MVEIKLSTFDLSGSFNYNTGGGRKHRPFCEIFTSMKRSSYLEVPPVEWMDTSTRAFFGTSLSSAGITTQVGSVWFGPAKERDGADLCTTPITVHTSYGEAGNTRQHKGNPVRITKSPKILMSRLRRQPAARHPSW